MKAARWTRRLAAVLSAIAAIAATAVLVACGGPEPAPAPVATPDPAFEQIRAGRAALGAPAVDLAESVLALRDSLDAARHDVPRGEAMRAALDEVAARTDAVREAADAAATAEEDLEGDSADAVERAREVVAGAVADARDAAAAADAEREALLALVAVDVRLEEAAASWDDPGSQSERRAALEALAGEMDALAVEAAALPVEPAACPGPAERRVAWAQLLADRSRRLETTANSALGREYDELRAAFAREPFGEDRRAADAADRTCWVGASPVADAADAAPGRVEDLEAALNP